MKNSTIQKRALRMIEMFCAESCECKFDKDGNYIKHCNYCDLYVIAHGASGCHSGCPVKRSGAMKIKKYHRGLKAIRSARAKKANRIVDHNFKVDGLE